MERTPEPRELVALLAEPDRLKALAAVALGANSLPDVAEYAGLLPKTAAGAMPNASISPQSSAMGTNSAGETAPRTGCSQRSSASNPAMRPSFRLTTGW